MELVLASEGQKPTLLSLCASGSSGREVSEFCTTSETCEWEAAHVPCRGPCHVVFGLDQRPLCARWSRRFKAPSMPFEHRQEKEMGTRSRRSSESQELAGEGEPFWHCGPGRCASSVGANTYLFCICRCDPPMRLSVSCRGDHVSCPLKSLLGTLNLDVAHTDAPFEPPHPASGPKTREKGIVYKGV